MYLPPHFEETRREHLFRLITEYPLGLLVTRDADGAPVVDPIPFLLDTQAGPWGTLIGHVARANPVWRAFAAPTGAPAGEQGSALVIFQGPQAYVSPSAYAGKAEHGRVVPTWNYAVVEARGRGWILDDARAHSVVSRLTQWHEAPQQRPWSVDDAPPDYVESMLKAIVCLEIPLDRLVGKFKLSQNRNAADRAGVATWLATRADEGARTLADWTAAASVHPIDRT